MHTTARNNGEGVTYVVDGYNVIRRVRRLRAIEQQHGLEQGREALLMALLESGVSSNGRIVVVFDGIAGLTHPPVSVHSPIDVRFSRPPQNADKMIVSILRSRPYGGTVCVITADRDLEWEAMKLGARVLDPEDWLSRLTGGKRPQAPEDPVATLDDVRWGLRVFGDERVTVETRSQGLSATSKGTPVPSVEEKNRAKERNKKRYLRRFSRRR